MRVVVAPAAVAAVLAALGGCNECPDRREGNDEVGVAFLLACNPNDLTRVVVTGPCADPDASLESYTGAATKWMVGVFSPSPGVCHIELQFATGFTYATDVTFTSQSDVCGSFIGPTSSPYHVNNPPNTCLASDAGDDGPDAGHD